MCKTPFCVRALKQKHFTNDMINVCLFTLGNLQNDSALRFILSTLKTYTYFYYDHYIIVLRIHLQVTISNKYHVHFIS